MADVAEVILIPVGAFFQTSVLQGLPLQHFKHTHCAFVSASNHYKCAT